MTEDELEEMLLGANATPEGLAAVLARLNRNLLGAALTPGGPHAEEAGRDLALLLRLQTRVAADAESRSGALDLAQVARRAAADLLPTAGRDAPEAARIELARAAALFLLESGATDPFAPARAREAWDRVREALRGVGDRGC